MLARSGKRKNRVSERNLGVGEQKATSECFDAGSCHQQDKIGLSTYLFFTFSLTLSMNTNEVS